LTDVTRVLGIDPGSQITGYGVIDIQQKLDKTVLINSGEVRTKGEHRDRLRQIFTNIGEVVKQFQPDEVSVERVFVHRNADSALKLGQARAAALCATFEADLPIYEYAARQIKKAIVGRGSADKTQVQHMVKLVLSMESPPNFDEADALAAALCHAHVRGTRSLLKEAMVSS
tara:strand:- start:308 stop:823 length:516 start_codon:yes stop_codon:yes gene_type:complete